MAVRIEAFKKELPPFLIGLAIGASIAALEKNFPRAKLQTHPPLSLGFRAVDEIMEFAAMRFINVFSHHWHWENIPYDPRFEGSGASIDGAPSGNPYNNPFAGVIAHLGGRPWGYVVEGERTGSQLLNNEGYFIGFRLRNTDYIRRCNLELSEPVMLLSGPDDGCISFAMDKDGNPLRLNKLSSLIHRKDKPAGIRIL